MILRFWWGFLPIACCLLSIALPVHAAKTKGTVRVLCIRVNFKDKKGAPSEDAVRVRIQSAKRNFERFSYGKLTINYQITPAVTLNKIRSFYSGSGLASAAEAKAANLGYKIGSYDIIGFYYQGGSVGAHAIVGGKRFWAVQGGATIHEMGHNFNYGHQRAFDPSGSNPVGQGKLETDPWTFMKSGGIDPEPFEKWRCGWITDRYDIQKSGSFKRRLYTFDQKDTARANSKRTMRVRRSTNTSKYFWLGFRSRLLNKNNGAGKNYHLRQGLALYWDRGNVGESTSLLDMHPATGTFDDHALQPGETFSDRAGNVHITNLGRGGEAPNEYIDVMVNKGAFSANRIPEPTWDVPGRVEVGETVTFSVTPNDPDGDAVACMWSTSDRTLSYNTSATTLTKKWNEVGNYHVTVVVSDMKGKKATLSKLVRVREPEPTPETETVPDPQTVPEVEVIVPDEEPEPSIPDTGETETSSDTEEEGDSGSASADVTNQSVEAGPSESEGGSEKDPPPPSQTLPEEGKWASLFELATSAYRYYASYGESHLAAAYYHYYIGLGNSNLYRSMGLSEDGDWFNYHGVALFNYHVYADAGDLHSANMAYNYYVGLAYYLYFLGYGDYPSAAYYYDKFFGLAFGAGR